MPRMQYLDITSSRSRKNLIISCWLVGNLEGGEESSDESLQRWSGKRIWSQSLKAFLPAPSSLNGDVSGSTNGSSISIAALARRVLAAQELPNSSVLDVALLLLSYITLCIHVESQPEREAGRYDCEWLVRLVRIVRIESVDRKRTRRIEKETIRGWEEGKERILADEKNWRSYRTLDHHDRKGEEARENIESWRTTVAR